MRQCSAVLLSLAGFVLAVAPEGPERYTGGGAVSKRRHLGSDEKELEESLRRILHLRVDDADAEYESK